MEFTLAEAESIDLAKKKVAEQLTKPEDLEKLEQYKRKISRKKATVESQLRNAVQTQLEGVQTGLENLTEAEKVIAEIKDRMADMEEVYHQKGAELSDVVRPIKEVNRKHQQLKTTSIHLHNIFNVPEAVAETHDLIKEQKLLEAHRKLSELEHTRDELLMQLYQGEDAYVDKNTSLHHYFEELIGLSENLGQSLWMTIHATTLLVAESPTQVVTALRIVEREERADAMLEEMLALKGIPSSQIPGRPKKWKSKCMEILETSIANKFEELDTTADTRMENKDWLTDHLTEVATVCYQDLQNIVTSGEKCFPSSYKIVSFFVKRYHRGLIQVISRLIDMGLNARDIITLMVWIGDVKASFAETLGLDLQAAGPLIKPEMEADLLKTCHGQVESNVRELMGNMVKTEQEEWLSQQPPECDVKGKYYTPVGINLFQIVEQNIQALSPLGPPTKMKILEICLDSLLEFQKKYRTAIDEYYKEAAAGRIQPPCFVLYIIAIANSCKSCVEFTEQLKKKTCMELNETTLDKNYESKFKSVVEEFDVLGLHCCDILLDVMFTDLKKVLSGLMTRTEWFEKPLFLVGTVEGTIMDFDGDFSKLKPAHHTYVIVQCQQRVIESYIQALCSKRMVCKKDKEREKVAECIVEESRKMSAMFLRLSHACNPKYTQVIEMMAEVIKSKQEFLPLDISALANKYREITEGHVVALIAMRGDMTKSQTVKMLQATILGKDSTTDGGEVDETRSTPSASGRTRKDEKNILTQIAVKNPWSMLK